MDILYTMPGQPHRLFINVVHACPNACLFCVDFKGDRFFGFDLKNGRRPTGRDIVDAVAAYPDRNLVAEVYYCGIGEPLLLYDTIMETVDSIRSLLSPSATVAINTSGTFYIKHKRVDFARKFDLIQISLNAENEEKYNQICRPKVPNVYPALMEFLRDLRNFIEKTGSRCRVELSVVDPFDTHNLPRKEKLMQQVPRPNIAACQLIADSFGWPLKIKRLLSDCEDDQWEEFADGVRSQMEIKMCNRSNIN